MPFGFGKKDRDGQRGKGRGRGRRFRFGRRTASFELERQNIRCICPECGRSVPHQQGMPYSVFGWYNEFLGEKQHIGVKIARVLVSYKIDLLFTFNIGKISYHLLKDNLVDIYKAEEGSTVKDIIECYSLNQLQPLTCPTHSVEAHQVVHRLKVQGASGCKEVRYGENCHSTF